MPRVKLFNTKSKRKRRNTIKNQATTPPPPPPLSPLSPPAVADFMIVVGIPTVTVLPERLESFSFVSVNEEDDNESYNEEHGTNGNGGEVDPLACLNDSFVRQSIGNEETKLEEITVDEYFNPFDIVNGEEEKSIADNYYEENTQNNMQVYCNQRDLFGSVVKQEITIEEKGEDETSYNEAEQMERSTVLSAGEGGVARNEERKVEEAEELRLGSFDVMCKRKKIYLQRETVNFQDGNGTKFQKCGHGSQVFASERAMELHSQIHLQRKRFKCPICEVPITCNVCKQGFVTHQHLLNHIRTSKLKYRHDCNVCNKRFTTIHKLRLHQRVHSGDMPYKCDVCGKKFDIPSRLKAHKRTHSGEKPYECDMCGKKFCFSSSLLVHKRIHTQERPYKCEMCKKAFIQLNNLKNHRRIHIGEKRHKCDVCEKVFSTLRCLKLHIAIHTGQLDFKCDVCNKGFVELGRLNIHKKIHTGEKPYICNVCHRGFSRLSHLKEHIKIHTGEKPYKCDVCNKGFTRPSHLSSHYKNIHTSLKFERALPRVLNTL